MSALRRWAAGPIAWACVLALVASVAAIGTHRANLDYGDDFALYLRQARSLVDGDVGRVVDDNAAMLQADPGQPWAFSPTAYPWVTPLLFAPFVRAFGTEGWAGLRLVVVAVFAAWIIAFVALLRRRLRPSVAVLTAATIAVAVPYVAGTNSLLSEMPYLLGATLFLLAIDRVAATEAGLLRPNWAQAALLGGMACLVFNTRREGIAAVLAIGAVQAHQWSTQRRRSRHRADTAWLRPHLLFIAAVVAFQALLPSALLPRYEGAGLGVAARKLWGPFRHSVSALLGFGLGTTVVGTAVLAVAAVGALHRLRAGDDVGLVAFVGGSCVVAASHPAFDPRYMMLATPFLVYLAAQGAVWLGERVRLPRWFVLVPLAALALHGAVDTARRVAEVQRANDAHEYLLGPGDPAEDAAIQAVRDLTTSRDVVAFFKARALTYLTDRRAIQTADRAILLREADFYLQRYDHFVAPGGFSPFLGLVQFSPDEAAALELEEVWRNDRWILWRLPDPTEQSASAASTSAEG